MQGTESREQGPAFNFFLYLYLKVLKIEFEQLHIKAAHTTVENRILVIYVLLAGKDSLYHKSLSYFNLPLFTVKWLKDFLQDGRKCSCVVGQIWQAWICIQIWLLLDIQICSALIPYTRGIKLNLQGLSQRCVQELICPLIFMGNAEP